MQIQELNASSPFGGCNNDIERGKVFVINRKYLYIA
jgi:hypothetical protein